MTNLPSSTSSAPADVAGTDALMALVVGVDSSTTACKVQVRDADSGEVISSASTPHPSTTPPKSEQDPSAWWSAFAQACDQAGVWRRHEPSAISIAGQQHGLVVMDAAGDVLWPAKLWNDTESSPDADALVAALGAQRWAQACGSVPVASFTITKLRWLQRSHPAVFDRVARVSLPHDWLTGQLTGDHTTDRGDASGTGWWSPAEGKYRSDLLGLIDPDLPWESMLPQVLGPDEVAGSWLDSVVAPGTGDNMAAALGLGLRPGDLAISMGTSGTACTVSDLPTADASGAVAGFADATGRFLPLVCTLNAMKVTDAMARLLGIGPDEFDALALQAPSGAGGPVLVPYLDGERTPNLPDATGTLTGMRSDISRAQLARATVDGVACNLLAGAAQLPNADGQVYLVGGGSHSVAVRQTIADLTGRVVVVPHDAELVVRGAAMQAAAVLAGVPAADVAAAWGLGGITTVEPTGRVDAAGVMDAYLASASRLTDTD